jgi:iron-sulfur cluster repair protein YtfE (RIC family)
MLNPNLMCDALRPGGASKLDPSMTVNDVIARHIGSIAVFNSLGVDACCGGDKPLRDAAKDAGLPLQDLLAALDHALDKGKVK